MSASALICTAGGGIEASVGGTATSGGGTVSAGAAGDDALTSPCSETSRSEGGCSELEMSEGALISWKSDVSELLVEPTERVE